MEILLCLLFGLLFRLAEPLNRIDVPIVDQVAPPPSRRILRGQIVADGTRPYMVYLRPSDPKTVDPNWLCGGAIIHSHHVLTSAACIENVKLFYVISGTSKYVPLNVIDDLCVKNGAKRVVRKILPKNYVYDGNDFNNIRWMANDIAIVKVDEDFNFDKRVKGCDFIPRIIAFNNQSLDLEKPLTEASIAGWGSDDKYSESTSQDTVNSPVLMEGKVVLISKKTCKKRWAERYHYIIDNYMICARDSDSKGLETLCTGPDCKDNDYEDEPPKRSRRNRPVRSSLREVNGTRRTSFAYGGFCENDHGGPLVVGQGVRAVVVGVISACMTKDSTQKCHGPFLFTSVFQNSKLITCVIQEESPDHCINDPQTRKNLVETKYNWYNSEAQNGSSITPSTVTSNTEETTRKKPIFLEDIR